MNADLVFTPEPEPAPALIDWVHHAADEELARIIDEAAGSDREH